jgi:hypothetical protein
MSGDQKFLEPIVKLWNNSSIWCKLMVSLQLVWIFLENNHGKSDHAFLKYMRTDGNFKHPTRKTFRTMEDASAVELDWFF